MFRLLARAYADVHPMMMDRSENRCGGNFLKSGSIINGADWYSFTGGEAGPGGLGEDGAWQGEGPGRGNGGGAGASCSSFFWELQRYTRAGRHAHGRGGWRWGHRWALVLVAGDRQDLGLPASGSG